MVFNRILMKPLRLAFDEKPMLLEFNTFSLFFTNNLELFPTDLFALLPFAAYYANEGPLVSNRFNS